MNSYLESPRDCGIVAIYDDTNEDYLYGIAVGIAVVGGENSSTTLTTARHPTAGGREHPHDAAGLVSTPPA